MNGQIDGIGWIEIPDADVTTYACREFGAIRVEKSKLTAEWIVTRAGMVKSTGHDTPDDAMASAASYIRETAVAKIEEAKARVKEAEASAEAVGA